MQAFSVNSTQSTRFVLSLLVFAVLHEEAAGCLIESDRDGLNFRVFIVTPAFCHF